MELLCDVGLVESRFSPFGDSISVGARYLHGLRHMMAQRSFWTQPMVLQGDEARVQYLVSVNLYIVLILMRNRCMVCAKRTIGSDIVLDAPGGTPR